MHAFTIRRCAAAVAALSFACASPGAITPLRADFTAEARTATFAPSGAGQSEDRLDWVWRADTRTDDPFTPAFLEGVADAELATSAGTSRARLANRLHAGPDGFDLFVDIDLFGRAVAPQSSVTAEVAFSGQFDFAVRDIENFSGVDFEAAIASAGSAEVNWMVNVDFQNTDFQYNLRLDERGPDGVSAGFRDLLDPGVYTIDFSGSAYGQAFGDSDASQITELSDLQLRISMRTLPTPGAASLFGFAALGVLRRRR
ncbi:MAG: hypothetical protein ACF8QF_03385 [Phycisphaerales bacterium]